jgi:hypothetical protein
MKSERLLDWQRRVGLLRELGGRVLRRQMYCGLSEQDWQQELRCSQYGLRGPPPS